MAGALNASSVIKKGIRVSLNADDVTRDTASNPTYAGVQYNSSGSEFANNVDGSSSYTVSRGAWLDAGLNSEVWLERVINSGSLNSNDPGAGRMQMTSTIFLEVADSTIPGGPVECNVTINAYDAATDGQLLGTATYTLSATRS